MFKQAMCAAALASMPMSAAHASEPHQPAPEWGEHVDTLSRIIVLEADGRAHDWAAILWVLEHRRARSRSGDPEGAWRYCAATNHAGTLRARRILDAPLDELPRARRAQVERAQSFVTAWIDGRIADPCAGATHWAGTGDAWPSHLRVVSCGPTLNIFGRERAGDS